MAYITAYPTNITTVGIAPENNNDWVNPNNVKADDGNNASITHSSFDSPDISYQLKCQGFDFSAIPSGQDIHGILVEIERNCDAGETGKDYRVQILDADGNLAGNNKADTANNWPTSPTLKQYGGATDTWNINPTVAMVKDADFGVVLSAQATSANADIYVDYIRITIFYGTIDVGAGARDLSGNAAGEKTIVDCVNPANADGTIETFEVWAYYPGITNLEGGIFFVVSGNTLQCRDSELLGNCGYTSKTTFTGVEISCLANDYIGGYLPASNDKIEYYYTGGGGTWVFAGEAIDPTDQATYTLDSDADVSLYGLGTESAPPADVFFENRHPIELGMKALTAASMGGVLIT